MARLPPLFYPSSLEFFPSSPNLSSGLSSNHFLFLFSFSPLFSFLLPYFRSRHGVFFEATGSLLSLLRSGARDAYRQFFVDSMSLIQGTDKLQLCTRCLCSNTSNLVIAIFLSMIDGLMLICLFSHSQIFYTWLHSVLMDPPGPG